MTLPDFQEIARRFLLSSPFADEDSEAMVEPLVEVLQKIYGKGFVDGAPHSKTQAHRRLLDMLYGWMTYLDKCTQADPPHHDVASEEYEAEMGAVLDLFQAAGGMLANRDQVPDDETLRFVTERVLPLLARG